MGLVVALLASEAIMIAVLEEIKKRVRKINITFSDSAQIALYI